MKVLVIYDSECREEVKAFREKIAEKFGKDTVLRISDTEREKHKKKKIRIKHKWHYDASRLIKISDMVIYYVSENSAENKNVAWEIKKCQSLHKYIICLRKNNSYPINESLKTIDKNTKEFGNIENIVSSEEEIFKIIDDFNKDGYINLFNNNKYDQSVLLEQYRIFTDSAESLISRRQTMNSFYISANTALITIGASVVALSDVENMIAKMIIILALSLPGIMLNISWRKILQSYFINNRGKMKVLSMIEKRLAVSLYDAEWKAMKNKYSKEKYVSFTESEKVLPTIFIIFYALADLVAAAVLVMLLVKIFQMNYIPV